MAVEGKMRRRPGRGEKALAVLVLFALTKAFFSLPENSVGLRIQDNGPSGNVLFALVYGATLVLVLGETQACWQAVRKDLLLPMLVILTLLSTLWSSDPHLTLRNASYLAATTLVGVYLAARYSKGEQMELAGAALAIVAVLSLLVCVALPSYGVDGTEWRGILPHKNKLGRYMALATTICALIAVGKPRWRWLAVGGLSLAGGLVLLSRSGTALVIVVTMGFLVSLYAAAQRRMLLAGAVVSAMILVAGASAILILTHLNQVLSFLQKDTTLTGRTPLWGAVVELILRRPWLGYGYQAFWSGEGEDLTDVWKIAGWDAGSAHNGFLDMALGIGTVGLGLFSLSFLLSFGRAVRTLRREGEVDGMWPAVFLSYLFLCNLTETSVLLPNNIFWALYVGTALSLPQERARRPKPRTRARLGMLAAQREGRPHRAVEHTGSRDGRASRPTE